MSKEMIIRLNEAQNLNRISKQRERAQRIIAVAALAAIWGGATNRSWGALPTASLTGTTLSENFDGMTTSATAATPTGFGFGTNIGSATTAVTADAGTSGTGALTGSSGGGAYEFVNGVLTTGTDKAIGFLNTGSFTSPRSIIYGFTNNTGHIVTDLSLNFDYEKYRTGTRAFGYTFLSSTDGSTFAAAGAGAGDQAYAADGANAVVNPPTTISKTGVSIDGLNIANGSSYYLLWTFTGVGGSTNGQGIGIDNFNLTATLGAVSTGGPASLTFAPGTRNWNTTPTNQNWTNDSTAAVSSFNTGDSVTFNDAGVGTVNVDAGGVAPANTTISNSTGTYTFTGGSINGSGALKITGAGNVVLSAANNYGGGTQISGGGTVEIASDASLGIATATLQIGGNSTLQADGTVTSTRAVVLTTGGATFNTNGNAATFTGGLSGANNLTKTGGGTLTFSGLTGTTLGTVAVGGGALALVGTSTPTIAMTASNTPGTFAGDLNVGGATTGAIRLNILGGSISGGGNVNLGAGSAISANAATALTTTINNNIVTNSGTVFLGGISPNTLAIGGTISGPANVTYSAGSSNNGSALVVLNAANSYTGASTINSTNFGILQLGINNALPDTALNFGVTGAAATGGIDLNGFSQTVKSLAKVTTGSVNGITNTSSSATPAELHINGGAATSYGGVIGYPTFTPVTSANNNIKLVLDSAHTGTLTLGGNNTYVGGTVISGGTLATSSLGALGFGTAMINQNPGSTTINTGGTLDVAGQAITEPITLNGGTLGNSGGSVSLVNGVKGTSFSAAGTGLDSSNVAINFTGGGGSGAAATPLLGVTANSFTISSGGSGYTTAPSVSINAGVGGATATATISGGSVTGITITNPGVGITGNPTIVFSGGGGGTGASVSGNSTNYILTGIQQNAAGSGYTSAPVASFSGTGTGVVISTPVISSITLQSTSSIGGAGDIAIAMPIGGNGGLTKTGADNLTLSAVNTYSGNTTASAGTLSLRGAPNVIAQSPTINVASGATLDVNDSSVQTGTTFNFSHQTLKGSGSVNGPVLLDGTSTISPGNSNVGTLSTGALTLSNGTAASFWLGAPTVSGLVNVGGALTVPASGSGSVTVNLANDATQGALAAGTYELFSFSSLTNPFDTSEFNLGSAPSGFSYAFSEVGGNQIDVTLTGGAAPTNLVWSGQSVDWDVNSHANWNNGSTTFHQGDNVTFDDTNAGSLTVTTGATAVLPGSVTVNTARAYVFNGTGGIGGSTGLALSGGGSLTVQNANAFTGTTSVSGAGTTLHLTSAGTLGTQTLNVGSGSIANIDGLLTGTPAVTVNGTLTLGATDGLNGPTNAVLARKWGALVVGPGANLNLTPTASTSAGNAGRTVLVASSLSNSGKIDLSNNDMIVQNTSAATLFSQLQTGFNAHVGYWDGPSGIVSTSAHSDTRHLTTIGYRQSPGGLVDTVNTTTADALVRYTYYGDADLNGTVNGADYQQIDMGFGTGATGWFNGDFNYDGVINGSDFALIDNTFNQITATGATSLALVADSSTLTASPLAISAVPEPTTLGLLGIGAMPLLGRRRRKLA